MTNERREEITLMLNRNVLLVEKADVYVAATDLMFENEALREEAKTLHAIISKAAIVIHTLLPWRKVESKPNAAPGCPIEAEIRSGNRIVLRLGRREKGIQYPDDDLILLACNSHYKLLAVAHMARGLANVNQTIRDAALAAIAAATPTQEQETNEDRDRRIRASNSARLGPFIEGSTLKPCADCINKDTMACVECNDQDNWAT